MPENVTSAPQKKILAIAIGVTVGVILALGILFFSTMDKSGGDFSLSYRGQKWTYSKDPRKINLLYMGYANCPDICPLTLSVVAQAFKKMSAEELQNVRQIFVSVDYPHDTPESVATYAAQFNPSFIGLTGAGEEIKNVAKKFGIAFRIEEAPETYLKYTISHTDKLLFLDAQGKIIDFVANPRSSEDIFAKTQKHLSENK